MMRLSKLPILFAIGLMLISHHIESQTIIFSNNGTSYNNTDVVTTNNYGPVNVSNCSSISFSLQYNFSLPFPGGGNMESSDECPFSGGCSGDPNDAASGGCANCWDFIYVQFQIGGVTVNTKLVGVPGSTNQSGTLNFGPVCTNGALDAGIIVQTQTWAANETITFSNITVTCWDASAMLMANPDPVCSGLPFTLSSTLSNPASVGSTLWTGPGTIATPVNLSTLVTGAPIGTNTYTFTATDDNACTNSSTIDVVVNQGPTLDVPPNVTVCADDPVNVSFTGTVNPTVNWTNSNPAIGLGANGMGDINFVAASVAATTTGIITITPSENGCTGPSQTFSITVNPVPTVMDEPDLEVCAGVLVSTGFSGSPGATFSWTNDNPAIGLGATGSVVGAASFSFTAANVNNQEVANIEVTPSLNGCAGTPITYTITVNPAPTVVDPVNQMVCAGDPVDVIFSGTVNPDFNWTNNNPAIGLGVNGTGDISFTAAGVLTTTTGIITVTPTEAGCPGSAQTFTVTVNPVPVFTQPADVTVCAGAAVTTNFAGSPGATFDWINDNPAIGLGASGSGNLNFISANSSQQEVANISVTPIVNGCPGMPLAFTITVNPAPTVTDPANQTVCAGDPVDVIFSGTVNPVFNWTNNNPAIGLGANGTGDISFAAANVLAATTGTITVTPSEDGCPGPAQTFTITVNPIPTVNQPADVTVCAGTAVVTNFTGSAGASFDWVNDNPAIGLGVTGSGNLNFISANNAQQEVANITVTPSINGCPGIPRTFSITVNPAPTVTDPANQMVCAGDPVDVIFSGTVNPVFNWTNNNPAIGLGVSGAGDINFTTANVIVPTTGTITVTPVEAGCPGSAQTFTITVNPMPTANQPTDVTVCAGAAVVTNFTGSAGASFDWVNDNPAIGLGVTGSGNLNFISANNAQQEVANITVTPSINGCLGIPLVFTITVNPAPTVTDPANQTVCAGDPVDVIFSGTVNPVFNWTNNNPAIGLGVNGTGDISFTTANVIVPTTGTITVTPAEAGCPGTQQSFTITVSPLPSMNQPNDQSVCVGTSVIAAFSGSPGSVFNWVNDNPAIGLGSTGSGTLNFVAANVSVPQIANITVTPLVNGCLGNPLSFTITVNPRPTVVDEPNQTVCSGESVMLTFSGTDNPVFNWVNNNPGIGLAAAGSGDIDFVAGNAGTATITVTPTENGCVGAPQTFDITVTGLPVVNQSPDIDACAESLVSVAFSGTAGATFAWTNSDPAIGLSAAGTGSISFSATNVGTTTSGNITVTPGLGGCTGVAQTFGINIHPLPAISINTVGCASDLLTYTIDLSSSGAITATAGVVSGSGGNFTISDIPAGTDVTITSTINTTGCTSQQTVNAPDCNCLPVLAPVGSNLMICEGEANPTLNVSAVAGTTVDWYATASGGIPLSIGNTGYSPMGPLMPGVYTFYAEARDLATNCTSTTRLPINLTVKALPSVTPLADQTVCAGTQLAINFTGTTSAQMQWTNSNPAIGAGSSGNGDINFLATNGSNNPILSNFVVTPTLNGCVGAPDTFMVTVNPIPLVAAPSNLIQCGGSLVSIIFTGTMGASFDWTNSNPLIGLGASGTGNIGFMATNASIPISANISVTPSLAGCTGLSQNFNVTINPMPEVAALSSQSVCVGNPVLVNFMGSNGAVFNWTNSNANIGLSANGTGPLDFISTNAGNTALVGTIEVTPNQNGCSGMPQTFTITVNPLPGLTIDSTSCSSDLTAYSIHVSSNANALASTIGTVSGMTPNYEITGIPITSNAVLTVSNTATGCVQQQTVNAPNCNCAPVSPAILPNNPVVCEGASNPALTVSASPGYTVDWYATPAGGAPLLIGNSSFTPAGVLAPGIYKFYAEVRESASNCTSATRLEVTLTVNPKPLVVQPADQSVCAGTPLNINFTGSTAAVMSWTNSNTNIGLGASGTGDISFTANNTGNVPWTANLIVTPALNGCTGAAQDFSITVNPIPNLTLDSIKCSLDLSTYTIYTTSNANALNAVVGTVTGSGTAYQITGIPSGTNTLLTATNTSTGCMQQLLVNAPNCNCAPVSAASMPNNPVICEGAPNPVLSVIVAAGLTVDWFTAPSGGTPLLVGSSSYTPPGILTPGIYRFYAETRDVSSGCTSTTRVVVTVTVYAATASVVHVVTCDPSQVGTATTIIPNAAGCDSLITTITTLDNSECQPAPVLSNGAVTCFGNTNGVLNLSATGGIAPYQYSWSNGVESGSGQIPDAGNPVQIQNLPAGVYTVTITAANGLSTTISSVVTSPPLLTAQVLPQFVNGQYALSCSGSMDGRINALANGGNLPYQYNWNVGGQSTATLSEIGAGTYSVTVTDANQCSASSSVVIQDPPALSFEIAFAEMPCNQESTTALITPSNGTGPFMVEIDGVPVAGGLMPGIPVGNHLLIVQDANGCEAEMVVQVNAPEKPLITLPAEVNISLGDTLVLEAQTNLSSWQSLVWDPAPLGACPLCLRQEWLPLGSGIYEVTITDNGGCSASASVRVLVENLVDVYIPNIFSPTDDGLNDFWTIQAGTSVRNLKSLQIFDRWGELVYALGNPVPVNEWPGWDGNFRTDPVNPGVFVYYLELELENGEIVLKKGDVTVLR